MHARFKTILRFLCAAAVICCAVLTFSPPDADAEQAGRFGNWHVLISEGRQSETFSVRLRSRAVNDGNATANIEVLAGGYRAVYFTYRKTGDTKGRSVLRESVAQPVTIRIDGNRPFFSDALLFDDPDRYWFLLERGQGKAFEEQLRSGSVMSVTVFDDILFEFSLDDLNAALARAAFLLQKE